MLLRSRMWGTIVKGTIGTFYFVKELKSPPPPHPPIPRPGAPTHNTKGKSHTLYHLSQPRTPESYCYKETAAQEQSLGLTPTSANPDWTANRDAVTVPRECNLQAASVELPGSPGLTGGINSSHSPQERDLMQCDPIWSLPFLSWISVVGQHMLRAASDPLSEVTEGDFWDPT